MKINYELNEDNTIKGYTTFPIDENKPYIELENTLSILLNNSKIIEGKLVNDFDIEEKLKEMLQSIIK